jgi:hypothetical protein
MPVVAAVASEASPPRAAPIEGVSGMRASTGACVSHDTGPITSRIRPSEMFTKARTSDGSNWEPAHRAISCLPSTGPAASLYERFEVITSNTSAIATIRPANGISSPATPLG